MPALDRNEKITCDKCGTQTTKKNVVRHKTRCSAGTLYSTQCPNFSTTSQADLNYHIAKKHSAAGPKNNHTCEEWSIEFPSFYSLRHHKQRYHTAETTSIGEKATCKVLPTQEMTKAWKKSYSRVDISRLILKNKKGDTACSILFSTTLQLKLSKKNWIAFWIILSVQRSSI